MKTKEKTESTSRLDTLLILIISISHLNFRYRNRFKALSNKRLNQCVCRSYRSEGFKI